MKIDHVIPAVPESLKGACPVVCWVEITDGGAHYYCQLGKQPTTGAPELIRTELEAI